MQPYEIQGIQLLVRGIAVFFKLCPSMQPCEIQGIQPLRGWERCCKSPPRRKPAYAFLCLFVLPLVYHVFCVLFDPYKINNLRVFNIWSGFDSDPRLHSSNRRKHCFPATPLLVLLN
jgi:hypothetical protein